MDKYKGFILGIIGIVLIFLFVKLFWYKIFPEPVKPQAPIGSISHSKDSMIVPAKEIYIHDTIAKYIYKTKTNEVIKDSLLLFEIKWLEEELAKKLDSLNVVPVVNYDSTFTPSILLKRMSFELQPFSTKKFLDMKLETEAQIMKYQIDSIFVPVIQEKPWWDNAIVGGIAGGIIGYGLKTVIGGAK